MKCALAIRWDCVPAEKKSKPFSSFLLFKVKSHLDPFDYNFILGKEWSHCICIQ